MGHQKAKQRRIKHRETVTATDSVATAPIAENAPVAASIPTATESFVIDYAPLRRDLFRVAVVLLLVSLALATATVSNQKTGWLDRAAGQLVHWLKLDQ